MKEQLITFKTAKLAKEKGLLIPPQKNWYTRTGNFNSYSPKSPYWVITQSLLQKWLREEYIIDINITRVGSDFPYYLQITQYGNKCDILGFDEYFIIYEEALEKGLQEALKL